MYNLLAILVILLVLTILCIFYLLGSLRGQKQQHEHELKSKVQAARKDSQKRATAVQFGKTIEHFTPFMKDFPISPRDVTFLGMPIDFVGFTNTDSKEKCKVHFIEVKSGNSFLLKKQQNIRNAIKKGRVEWHELKIDTENKFDN